MATRKSNEEKLQDLELKMKQLQAQKQALVKREQEKERKERTRRLIENGALAEKYLNCDKIAPKDFEELLKKIVSFEPVKATITPKESTNNSPISNTSNFNN